MPRPFRTIFPLFILLLSFATSTSSFHVADAITTAASTPSFDYIVIIIMENHPLNTSACCGAANGIIGNSQAPYITQLAHNYSLAGNYFAVNPGSLPNYLALIAANTFTNMSCVNNDSPPSTCIISAPNIVDRIETSGGTWRAYMEDYTGGCFGANISGGHYVYYHNPFPYFANIQSNSTRCNRIVAANPGHVGLPDNQLITDLNSSATPNYMFLTPNECDNMHDCPISSGDTYLSQLVPKILNSTVFKTQTAALFITWDEPTTCTCPIPAIWVGPMIRRNYVSQTSYTHHSLLKTLETAWNLSPLTSNDSAANSMNDVFVSTVGGTVLPLDKLMLLAPFIGTTLTILVAAMLGFRTLTRKKRSQRP